MILIWHMLQAGMQLLRLHQVMVQGLFTYGGHLAGFVSSNPLNCRPQDAAWQHAIVGHKEICAFGIHLPCYVCPGYRCRSGHMYGSPVFFQAFKTSLVTIMDSLQVCRETKVPFLHVFGVHILADGSGSSSNERAGLRRGPCV